MQMNKKIITLSLVTALTTASAAYAADTSQGRFYGRVDFGYGLTKSKVERVDTSQTILIKPITTATAKDNGRGMLGAFGLGYYATKDLRTELELYFDNGFGSKTSNTFLNVKAKEKTMAAFANVFYDIKTSTPFTPYIMAGIGYGRNKIHVGELSFKKHNGLVYQGGFGVSYQINKNMDLDLGYRAIQKDGKKRTFTSVDSNKVTHVVTYKKALNHTLLAGIRVTF
jgi:opacity protein-like surface antigen